MAFIPAAAWPAIGAIGAGLIGGRGGGGGSTGPQATPATPEQIGEQTSLLPGIHLPSFHVPGVSEFFAPISGSTSAYDFSTSGGRFNLNRTGPNPLDLFDTRANTFFNSIDDLRSRFRPGFSEVRDARMAATTAARQRGLSNLRDSLATRRIQGSSFARAEQTQAENEFAKLEAEQQAQSFLEEVSINVQLLEQERQGMEAVTQRAQVDVQELQTALEGVRTSADVGTARQQLKLEAQIAAGELGVKAQIAELDAVTRIIQSLNLISSDNARIASNYAIEEASGRGEFFGNIFSGITDAFTDYANDRDDFENSASSGGGQAPSTPRNPSAQGGGLKKMRPVSRGSLGI